MIITKVTKKDYEEIETNEKYLNLYRRHNTNIWSHSLGEAHGWHPYKNTEFLEKAYQQWAKDSTVKKSK